MSENTPAVTFFPLADGLYKPNDVNDIVFISPQEILQVKGMPDTEEMRLALYESFKAQYAKQDIELILIEGEPTASIQEHVNNIKQEESNNDPE